MSSRHTPRLPPLPPARPWLQGGTAGRQLRPRFPAVPVPRAQHGQPPAGQTRVQLRAGARQVAAPGLRGRRRPAGVQPGAAPAGPRAASARPLAQPHWQRLSPEHVPPLACSSPQTERPRPEFYPCEQVSAPCRYTSGECGEKQQGTRPLAARVGRQGRARGEGGGWVGCHRAGTAPPPRTPARQLFLVRPELLAHCALDVALVRVLLLGLGRLDAAHGLALLRLAALEVTPRPHPALPRLLPLRRGEREGVGTTTQTHACQATAGAA